MGGLITHSDMQFVSKRWGWELWIVNTPLYCGKFLFIKQGQYCSFHYHKIKDEVLYVQSGKMRMGYQQDVGLETQGLMCVIDMTTGMAFHITPNLCHQMEALEDTLIIEFSTQHFDEDSYSVTRDLVLYGDSEQ